MILLSGHSLTQARKLPVEALSLQLKERDSSATMTPADMDGITVNTWVKDDTEPGKNIVWRVKSIGQAYATATPTVQLEHMIASLKDVILFGEHKPAQITGNSKATTCTAEQAVRYVLSKQSDWTLGSFSYGGVTNPYKFDGDTLFDCLETITSSLTDAWWSYDFSSYPFKLNITQKSSAIQSELRAARNLKTITKTIDKSGMYTRFYPIGANDLHLDGDYVEKNVAAYGVISKVETDQSIETQAELARWASERLNQHAEPSVTIDVEGLELADATGETMDRLQLGAVCRIPLPEFGTTITERIVSLSYQDKVHQPEVVKIQLSNTRQDLTNILADALKSGSRGGRSSAKRDKEDLAWFEDTNEHVAMCAKGIIGVDAQGNPNWVRLTQLIADGNGLDSTVSSIQNNVTIAQTQITQNETSINMVVKSTDNRPTSFYPKRAYFPATGDPEKKYFAIDENRYYEWKNGQYVRIKNPNQLIDAGAITLAINEAGDSEATIKAKKVLIGELNDEDLNSWALQAKNGEGVFAKFLTVKRLTAQDIETLLANIGDAEINGLDVTGHTDVTSLTASVGITTLTLATEQINECGIDDFIANASVSGNTLTLTKVSGDEITFSKATSLSGEWSSGHLHVLASPQSSTYDQYIVDSGEKENLDGTPYTSGSYWYVPVYAKDSAYDQNTHPTGLRVYVNPLSADSNLAAGNIKSGVEIFGITGTYIGSTTLAGTWSTGHLHVTSSPQSATYDQYLVDSGLKENLDGTTYTSGAAWYVPIYTKNSAYDPSGTATGLRIYVDPAAVDSNLTAANIKKDVVIFGITGTYNGPGYQAPYGTAIGSILVTTGYVYANGLSTAFSLANETMRPQGSSVDIRAVKLTLGSNVIGRVEVPTEECLVTSVAEPYTPSEGKVGFRKVTVDTTNLDPANIKSGVVILGVTGTYSGQGYQAPYGSAIGNILLTTGNVYANGLSTAFTLSRESMTPQGTSATIKAVKLTLGSNTIGRIEIPLEECTVNGVGPFEPSDSKVGFSKVNVDSTNLTAGNIKNGVTILGVTGTYAPAAPYGTAIGSILQATGSISGNGLSSTFTLANESMTPQGTSTAIRAVKLTLAGTVIGRVEVPLEECTVNGIGPFVPSDSKVGFSKVNVDTTNLTAGNIKNGVTILGVTGTYTPSYQAPYGTAIGSTLVTTGSVTANGVSSTFTLANESMTPQGTSTAIRAVKLTLGSRVIGRVEVPLEDCVVTGEGPYTPSSGKAGFRKVTVDTTNLKRWNIKSGVTILGVEGTYSPSYQKPTGTAIGNILKTTGNITANEKTSKFTLANETMTPQGTSTTIKAVKLTLGTDVIGRIEVTKATPTITGVAVADDQNDHNPGVLNVAGTGILSTDQNLTITNGSWSAGKMATNIRVGDSSGTLIARRWVYAPSVSLHSTPIGAQQGSLIGTLSATTVGNNRGKYIRLVSGGKSYSILIN